MLGTIIRPIQVWNKALDNRKSIFLAGGSISNSNWQEAVGQKLIERLPIVVLDPRALDSATANEHSIEVVQMYWGCRHIAKCDHVVFWFNPSDDEFITTLELGCYLSKDISMSIGTDLNYKRRFDVEVQTSLIRPRMHIWSNLDCMIENIISLWDMPNHLDRTLPIKSKQ